MSEFLSFLSWEPLVWLYRIAGLMIGILLNLILVAVLVRAGRYLFDVVFRWRRLPAFEEVSGKMLGVELALKRVRDRALDEQIYSLDARVNSLEETSRKQAEAIERIVADLLEGESDAW